MKMLYFVASYSRARVETVNCDSRRVCAIRICNVNVQFSLLLINVYFPHEDDGNS